LKIKIKSAADRIVNTARMAFIKEPEILKLVLVLKPEAGKKKKKVKRKNC
jgi:hypothetical protein